MVYNLCQAFAFSNERQQKRINNVKLIVHTETEEEKEQWEKIYKHVWNEIKFQNLTNIYL